MTDKIHNVAIHDLIKTASDFSFAVGKTNVKVGATVSRVVDKLHGLYSRRSTKSHGKFSVDSVNYPTQSYLKTYLADTSRDFGKLTNDLMATLVAHAKQKHSATGGHVFIVHFAKSSSEYILIAVVNDILNAALTNSFDVQDVTTLDLDGFRFAGRVNLTAWANGDERYVNFLKGKGDVADYFKEFLGCDNVIQDRLDTQLLVKALKDFAEAKKIVGADRDNLLAKAKSICERSIKNQERIQLASFANELYPSEPDALLDVLTEESRNLNDGFVPDRKALGSLVKFKAKTKLWSVEFEREALTQGKISFDDKNNTLTFRDLPGELTAELRKQVDG